MTFLGNIEAKLDVKGRVFVPSAYRKCLPVDERDRVIVRVDTDNECLVVYPESTWSKMVAKLQASLNEWDAGDRMLLMQFVSDAEVLDMDSQGRILISKKYAQYFDDGNEVVFVGMVDRIVMWGKKNYENSKIPRGDFAKVLSEKMR